MSLPNNWKVKRRTHVTEYIRKCGYDETSIEIDKEDFYFCHSTVEFTHDGGQNISVNFDVPIEVIIEVLKEKGSNRRK